MLKKIDSIIKSSPFNIRGRLLYHHSENPGKEHEDA